MSRMTLVEVAPLRRAHEFGDVPGPDFVGLLRQKLGFLVSRMAQLLAAFADLAIVVQDPVHGADRAVVDAFVQ